MFLDYANLDPDPDLDPDRRRQARALTETQ
jgi:hypothetical protein